MKSLLAVLAVVTLNGATCTRLNGKFIEEGIRLLDIGSFNQHHHMDRMTLTGGHISAIELNSVTTVNVSHISFVNCTIGTINSYAFDDIINLQAISFICSTIGEIKPFAFSGTTAQVLVMESCTIDVMYNFAFERLEVEHFKIFDCGVTGCMGSSTFSAMSSKLDDVQVTGNDFVVPPNLNGERRAVGKEYYLKCTNGWSVIESQVWIYYLRHCICALCIASFFLVLLTVFVSRKACVGRWTTRALGVPISPVNAQVCDVKEYRRILGDHLQARCDC
ncbi:hypothetical protein CAPTEDRAFT_189443 [Capitella teleta]|uniref:SRCR domain-containing protein n=1 Tax=Capitella teleta TaxID=283909 RepID=R7VIN7_CAPTE|nr:hypothetical protein CAPTEDRAFT_189443 [Capitella teleta]|eukprot:ELU15580.1 hypothetical protein CAPTEDRAFT_189443 [Capitella teleta]